MAPTMVRSWCVGVCVFNRVVGEIWDYPDKIVFLGLTVLDGQTLLGQEK